MKQVNTFGRCQAKRDNGCRCRKQATTRYEYFGDRQTSIGAKCQWVAVDLCDEHGIAPPVRNGKKGGERV